MRSDSVKRLAGAGVVLALAMVVPVTGFATLQRRSKRNKPPTITSFSPSARVFAFCPFGPSSSSGNTVALEVTADDPDKDSLTYKYSVDSGSIVGDGARVNWDLSRSPLGFHTAKVEVIDQRGARASATTRVEVIVHGTCDPPCPSVTVTCPSQIEVGEIASFVTAVGGVGSDVKITYLWSHSNGQRLPGQVGSEFKIKALGLPGDVITATVRVLGLDPACSQQASCESRIVKATAPSEK